MATKEDIQEHFQTKGLSVPVEWVDQCIQFLQQEYGNQINNSLQLKDKAYDQWLHSNLTDLGSCCLPLRLNEIKCTHIKGKFFLQINKIHDIGASSYKQFQKLNKEENENVNVSGEKIMKASWQPKSSRMLMIELTDGTSVVNGMEYMPMPSISLSFAPGSKVIVEGEIEVRRGILLLKENHLKYLGGSVESLSISHALDNVLRCALNLEETENPVLFDGASLQTIENVKENKESTSTWQKKPLQSIKKEQKSFTGSNSSYTKPKQLPSSIIEDDFDGDIEMAMMQVEHHHIYTEPNIKIENNLTLNSKWPKRAENVNFSGNMSKPMQNKLTPFKSYQLNNSAKNKKQCTKFNNIFIPKVKTEKCNNEIIKKEIIVIDDSDDEDLFLAAGQFEDTFDENTSSNYCKATTSQLPNKYIKLDHEKSTFKVNQDKIHTQSSLPFQYLNSMPDNVLQKIHYTIKGFVMTLTSKLKQENGIHVLTVQINDGTGACEVNLHDMVIRKMIGLTATELSKRISDSKSNHLLRPAIAEKMNNFQKSLISICCLFKLELSPLVKRPTVVDISPINASHLNQLKNRMQ